MKAEEYFDQIQSYLSGQMSDDENKAFEQQIANDEDLQQAVAIHRLADDAIELSISQDLRSELSTLSKSAAPKQTTETKGRVVTMRRRIYALSAAASVLLLLGFFGWWYGSNNYSDQALANQYFTMDDIGQVRSSGPDAEPPMNQGIRFLQEGRIDAAADYFSRINDGAYLAEAQYYLGIAQHQMGRYNEAIAAFDRSISLNNLRFMERAEYRKMLTLFAAGRKKAAEAMMQMILENPDHYGYPDTQSLQESRDNGWGQLF